MKGEKSEFEKFKKVMQDIVKVSKKEIEAREKEWRSNRAENKK